MMIAAFAANRLRPVLGLDLQGGVSVILSAPEGTDADTMNTALENIRNRVDAFGVGEPDIALSGTTIEIQIPGLSDSTVEERTADLECIADAKGATYGCSGEAQAPTTALKGFDVASQVAKVCVVAGDTELTCLQTQAAADAAAKDLGVPGFENVQNDYSLLSRGVEDDVIHPRTSSTCAQLCL